MRGPARAPEGVAGVVQVLLDSPVPHLDREFDYLLPTSADHIGLGWRVRVRFSGRLMNAYVVGRTEVSEHTGTLRPIERAIGIEPVLTEETLTLARAVAERWAGTVSDVLRSAVPPRHARAEGVEIPAVTASGWPIAPERWSAYGGGRELLDRLGSSAGSTRAVWSIAPGSSFADEVGDLASAAAGRGRGVIIVVPDATDVARVTAVVPGATSLTADAGPERRYREFVRVLRGGAPIVVGTRSAVFAPVPALGLIIVWDDGDDAHIDPQAPYWHARDVAALRAHLSDCDLVVGSPARSVATAAWVRRGWATSVAPTRETVHARGPAVRALVRDDAARDPAAAAARIPHTAWQAAHRGLAEGPVLIQVARRGYVPVAACQTCREIARCSCGGPIAVSEQASQCSWCGTPVARWACPRCGDGRLRAVAIGADRTVEEVGRAFPGVPVLASHAGRMLGEVGARPAVVVATPGAEPWAEGGYRAVLLLDARAMLDRPRLDAQEDAMRRWFAAARLAAPRAPVVVVAANEARPVQALVRWDAPWCADHDLAERAAAGFPPATRIAALTGKGDDLAAVAAAVDVPHEALGPVPSDRGDRLLLRVARRDGAALAVRLRALLATRSAARAGVVHVHMDPHDL